jgi:hypothetical protein
MRERQVIGAQRRANGIQHIAEIPVHRFLRRFVFPDATEVGLLPQ